MANKKLKTIQFPGLPDTYTVPQVENGVNNNVAVLDGAGNVKDSSSGIDTTVTQNSGNLITSGAVYSYIQSLDANGVKY